MGVSGVGSWQVKRREFIFKAKASLVGLGSQKDQHRTEGTMGEARLEPQTDAQEDDVGVSPQEGSSGATSQVGEVESAAKEGGLEPADGA